MNKHDDIQILIGSKGWEKVNYQPKKKLYNGDTKCRNQFLFMWCIFSVIVLYAADIHFIGHKFIWEKKRISYAITDSGSRLCFHLK